ncbi:hypothetical protein L2735_15125 [Shewanella olleyana]|uniref:hypothetical protein n=1 Tax=Shewanella olleyana TaxID=135626 RepID=UPI00200F3819|nr:hypothetical protein [Shewanella olleyana]MCL1068120.1 hypothetical protein [Shewanella olleyana]
METHQPKCQKFAYSLKPSFIESLPKAVRQTRASIVGTYEWAINSRSPKKSNKLYIELKRTLSQAALEKEVRRLESEVVFNETAKEMRLNRQVLVSKLLQESIRVTKRLNDQAVIEQQKAIDIKKEKDYKRLLQKPVQGNALFGEVKKYNRHVVSGGAFGQGKRS